VFSVFLRSGKQNLADAPPKPASIATLKSARKYEVILWTQNSDFREFVKMRNAEKQAGLSRIENVDRADHCPVTEFRSCAMKRLTPR